MRRGAQMLRALHCPQQANARALHCAFACCGDVGISQKRRQLSQQVPAAPLQRTRRRVPLAACCYHCSCLQVLSPGLRLLRPLCLMQVLAPVRMREQARVRMRLQVPQLRLAARTLHHPTAMYPAQSGAPAGATSCWHGLYVRCSPLEMPSCYDNLRLPSRQLQDCDHVHATKLVWYPQYLPCAVALSQSSRQFASVCGPVRTCSTAGRTCCSCKNAASSAAGNMGSSTAAAGIELTAPSDSGLCRLPEARRDYQQTACLMSYAQRRTADLCLSDQRSRCVRALSSWLRATGPPAACWQCVRCSAQRRSCAAGRPQCSCSGRCCLRSRDVSQHGV